MKSSARSYDNSTRAKKADQTRRTIIRATEALWKKLPIHDITLEQVARESNVTVRTIIRKFGTKERLFEACITEETPAFLKGRQVSTPGDVGEALRNLLNSYEEMGEAGIRTIYAENELEIARKIGELGRKEHRQWCVDVFGPYLPSKNSTSYETKLIAFIAATEIYLWKLMRHDLGLSKAKTYEIFKTLVEGLIHHNPKESNL
jgi:AraC-like DNA-binding protein